MVEDYIAYIMKVSQCKLTFFVQRYIDFMYNEIKVILWEVREI